MRRLASLFIGVLMLTAAQPAGALAVLPTVGTSVRSEPLVWEQTALSQRMDRLAAPRSGALFAARLTSEDSPVAGPPFRSDDGGMTWRPVALVEAVDELRRKGLQVGVAVDPTDHTTTYALARPGLYKSDDDAQSWQRIDAPRIPGYFTLMALHVSPADHQIVYAAAKTQYGGLAPGDSPVWWLRRSDDGGATWQEIETRESGDSYQIWISALYPLPHDPDRVLRAIGGGGGGVRGHDVELSIDRGATWTQVLSSGSGRGPWYPRHFACDSDGTIYVGGSDQAGDVLVSSSDGGQTWASVPTAPSAGAHGLATDPTKPGRLYAAALAGVKRSDDGGSTWTDIGSGTPGAIGDIALGIDQRFLFAATDSGVWRLPLP
jgi:photosystem II stability/assembly factor-like uncharacterized protein